MVKNHVLTAVRGEYGDIAGMRAVLVTFVALREGPATTVLRAVADLTTAQYVHVSGTPSPLVRSGTDGAATQDVPACFAGKESAEAIPAAEWDSEVREVVDFVARLSSSGEMASNPDYVARPPHTHITTTTPHASALLLLEEVVAVQTWT